MSTQKDKINALIEHFPDKAKELADSMGVSIKTLINMIDTGIYVINERAKIDINNLMSAREHSRAINVFKYKEELNERREEDKYQTPLTSGYQDREVELKVTNDFSKGVVRYTFELTRK